MLRVSVPPRTFGFFHRIRLGWLLLAAVAAVSSLHADTAVRRRFDLPAGAALVTLKRAALQAELEIVYSAAVVEGVRTQAVAGEFTPIEALERMLSNTPLKIFQDPQTKVLSVTRRPDAALAPPPPSTVPKEPPQTMKRRAPSPSSAPGLRSPWAARIPPVQPMVRPPSLKRRKSVGVSRIR